MTRRELTTEELEEIPIYLAQPFFDTDENQFYAWWETRLAYSFDGKPPWSFEDNDEYIEDTDFEERFPGYSQVTNRTLLKALTGEYNGQEVRWTFKHEEWRYKNHKTVVFNNPDPAEPSGSEDPPESEDEQAEVSQLLEDTVQKVSSLITRFSRPQTPQTPTPRTPRALPGEFPVTPGPSSQVQALPTPAATVIATPARAPASSTLPVNPVLPATVPPTQVASPAQAPVNPPPVQVAPPAPPVHPVGTPTGPPAAGMAANPPPKLMGASPEPFDGKPGKAESFWTTLANYYFLNADLFPNEGKKVSSALTYFRLDSPAGEWARDRQKAALAQTPPDFGTWADFEAAFKKHFIPAHSKLEATNNMYTSRMNSRHFDEWYQEWSTYASRSGANEETKMFAFRKALPPALHQKILGVSPQPTTLDDLVDRAREFDRVWRLYNNPAFTGGSGSSQRGPRNRAMITEDDGTHVNAVTPQKFEKLSKEEKDRRFKNKLCLYCGKPGHMARDCRLKRTNPANSQSRNQRPRTDTRVRATAAAEDTYEDTPEEHPAQISALYQDPYPRFSIPRPASCPVNEDF